MSGAVDPAAMVEHEDTGKLIEEIDRYLAAIDLFRAVGCEPTWRPEMHPKLVVRTGHIADTAYR